MAEQVIWWGFLCATACSVLHMGVLAAHGLRKRRNAREREIHSKKKAGSGPDVGLGFEANFLARGQDSQPPFPEEVLARYFVGKGLLTESEFAELLRDEKEQYHAIVMDDRQH